MTLRIISYVGRAHWRIDNWYLAQNIRLREVFYIAQIMTTLILHPHTISDLTLTSVRRNDVLKYAQSFLHFFKIWKIYANDMKNWQKIRNSTEKKQTNKQPKNNNKNDKKKKYTIVFAKTRATLWYIKKICLTFKNRKKMRRAQQTFRPSIGVLSSYIWRLTNKISL